MMEGIGKITKGEWRVGDVITNGTEGYEIHYTDDGECITDHVYTLPDAKLISAAPDLLNALVDLLENYEEMEGIHLGNEIQINKARKAIEKALK